MKLRITSLLSVLLISTVFFVACSSSKDARKSKRTINGTWILKTISTEAINGKFTAKVFNEADYKCFIGSMWDFTSNNGTGSYTINGMSKDCPVQKRFVRWSIYEPTDSISQFQFKRLDDKKNPMDEGDGFRLDISSLDKTSMQLKSNITFEGHAAAIIYNFEKK